MKKKKTGLVKNVVAIQSKSTHNSQMKAKRRAANKACREQFEKRARKGKHKCVVDLDHNGIE